MVFVVSVALVGLLLLCSFKKAVTPYYFAENLKRRNTKGFFYLLGLMVFIYLFYNLLSVISFVLDSDGLCDSSLEDFKACTSLKWSSPLTLLIPFGFFIFFYSVRKQIILHDKGYFGLEISKWQLLFKGSISGQLHLKNTFRFPANREILISEFEDIFDAVKSLETKSSKIVIFTHIIKPPDQEQLKQFLDSKNIDYEFISKEMPLANKFMYSLAIIFLFFKKFERRKTISHILSKQDFSNWFKLTIKV